MSAIFVLVLRILLAASLYAFLGWALFTIWRDLQVSNQMVGNQPIPTIILHVQLPSKKETRRFTLAELIIGRDPSCECIIPDETVSAHHARLSHHHKQWWLEDLESTNGTFLNEERVSTATVIMSGDEVRCGKVLVRIEI